MAEYEKLRRMLEPEPNIDGAAIDCPSCNTTTDVAFYDVSKQTLSWRCTGCDEYIVLEDIGL